MTTTDADDLAARTSWEPLRRGGSTFATRRLVEVVPGRVAFDATAAARRFAWLFVGIGVAAPCVVLLFEGLDVPWWGLAAAALTGAMFVGAGVLLGREFDALIEFDLGAGVFKTERRLVDRERRAPEPVPPIALAEVAALQLVAVDLREEHGTSWELDLVLDDGRRAFVLSHGGREFLHEDAAWLADRLGVPLLEGPPHGR